MRLRNVNPAGAIYVPMLARRLDAGEVFEASPAEAAQLLRQPSNYESADAPLTRPHPRGIPGSWPTPSWWDESDGWCLLTLRCANCHRVAARFIAPASRQAYGLPAHAVAHAIGAGVWARASEDDVPRAAIFRQRLRWNVLPNPCLCAWDSWPSPADPRMAAALLRALTGPRPAAGVGPMFTRPEGWSRSPRPGQTRGATLTAPPPLSGQE